MAKATEQTAALAPVIEFKDSTGASLKVKKIEHKQEDGTGVKQAPPATADQLSKLAAKFAK